MQTSSKLSTELTLIDRATLPSLFPDQLSATVSSPFFTSGSLRTLSPDPAFSKTFLSRLSETLTSVGKTLSQAFLFLMYKQTDTVTIGEIDPTTETILNARAVRPNPNAPGEIVFQSRSKTVDGNPFGLSLSLSVGDVAGLKDNTFTLISAVPHQPSGVFLIQPWELAYDSRGWLSGQLLPLIQPNILNQTPKYIQSPERDRLSRRDLNAIAQKLTNLAKAGAAELSFKLDLSSLLTHQN